MACSLKMDVSLYGTVAVRDVEVRRSREILVPAAPSSSSMPWSGLSGDDPLSYLREIGDRIAAILDPNHDDEYNSRAIRAITRKISSFFGPKIYWENLVFPRISHQIGCQPYDDC